MWFFTNDFKYRHIIYRWKVFFFNEYEFKIVISKWSSPWLKSTNKVCRFCMKKCADNPETFFGNRGYHCDEEVKRGLLEPKNISGGDRRWQCNTEKSWLRHARCTRLNLHELASIELAPDQTAPSKASSLVHVR